MHEPTPTVSVTACLSLATTAVAGFGLLILVYVELFTPLVPARAAGAALAATFAVAGFAYISRSAEDRAVRRESAAVAVILERLERLEAQRVVYLPQPPKVPGVRHLAAVGESQVGLDPETIAAARALARRIVDNPADAE